MNKRMKALAIVSGVGGGGKQDDAADAGAKKKVTTRWGRNNKVEPGCSQPGCTRNNTVFVSQHGAQLGIAVTAASK